MWGQGRQAALLQTQDASTAPRFSVDRLLASPPELLMKQSSEAFPDEVDLGRRV